MVSLLRLCDADIDGVGNKARRLARLLRLDPGPFHVPRGVVVTDDFDAARDAFALHRLLDEFGPCLLAVRACGLAEDSGRDATEFRVAHDHVVEAIRAVQASLVAEGDRGAALIQPMLRSTMAGVLVTRSPSNAGLAMCEYAAGVGEPEGPGGIAPRHAVFGRWSEKIFSRARPSDTRLLERLFPVGMTIEQHLGGPQEIEWTYDARSERLTVLQTREITAQTCTREIAAEQARVAETVAETRGGRSGKPAFRCSIVREIGSPPGPMTRSLIERLYSPLGSLGAAFEILGLPHPKLARPYVTSLFGTLYADVEIESRLFGLRPRLWWSLRRLRRRLHADRADALVRLRSRIDALPQPTEDVPAETREVRELADRALRVARKFVDEIYPVAYVAALSAQLAGEGSYRLSANGRMMRELCRLPRGGEREEVEERSHVVSGDGEISFSGLEELATDRAVGWLVPFERALDALGPALGLECDEVFLLDLDQLEAVASDRYDLDTLRESVERARLREARWATIDLGDEPTLAAVERLRAVDATPGVQVDLVVEFAQGRDRHETEAAGEPTLPVDDRETAEVFVDATRQGRAR